MSDGSRPARAAPRASAGRTTSARYRGLWSGWTSSPSATSPATSIMRSRTAASQTGGAPWGCGRGRNAGGMSVWELNSPSKRSGSPVSHADQIARRASTYSRMRAAGRVHGTP